MAKIENSMILLATLEHSNKEDKALHQNSHENGAWSTATIETPENVIGEDNLIMSKATYDALYAAAVG